MKNNTLLWMLMKGNEVLEICLSTCNCQSSSWDNPCFFFFSWESFQSNSTDVWSPFSQVFFNFYCFLVCMSEVFPENVSVIAHLRCTLFLLEVLGNLWKFSFLHFTDFFHFHGLLISGSLRRWLIFKCL